MPGFRASPREFCRCLGIMDPTRSYCSLVVKVREVSGFFRHWHLRARLVALICRGRTRALVGGARGVFALPAFVRCELSSRSCLRSRRVYFFIPLRPPRDRRPSDPILPGDAALPSAPRLEGRPFADWFHFPTSAPFAQSEPVWAKGEGRQFPPKNTGRKKALHWARPSPLI